jgi:hypothetical protein
MRYLLLIYGEQSTYNQMSEAEMQADMQRWFDYTNELEQAGVSQSGAALQPADTATSVRPGDDGEPLVTDGPFAETREQLGGYYLLDVPDLDEAIKWAKKCPGVDYGTIELRPVMEFDGA